jgi:hypothetical protein
MNAEHIGLMLIAVTLAGCTHPECVSFHNEDTYVWKNGVQLGEPGVGRNVLDTVIVCDEWKR